MATMTTTKRRSAAKSKPIEVSAVEKIHAALWRARDGVQELEARQTRENAARAETAAAAMVAGDALPVVDGDAAERDAAELDAARRVVALLEAQHVAALQAEIDADHADALKRREAALARKTDLEGQLGPLLARMNEIKLLTMDLLPEIASPLPRSLRSRALTGTVAQLRAQLRDDPSVSLLPSELDRALSDVAEQERKKRIAWHSQGATGDHRHGQPNAGRILVHYDGQTGHLSQGPHGAAATSVLTWDE